MWASSSEDWGALGLRELAELAVKEPGDGQGGGDGGGRGALG